MCIISGGEVYLCISICNTHMMTMRTTPAIINGIPHTHMNTVSPTATALPARFLSEGGGFGGGVWEGWCCGCGFGFERG